MLSYCTYSMLFCNSNEPCALKRLLSPFTNVVFPLAATIWLVACDDPRQHGLVASSASYSAYSSKQVLQHSQAPWIVTLACVSPSASDLGRQASPSAPSKKSVTGVLSLKVRLASQNSKLALQEVFQQVAPHMSAVEQQNQLFHHMEETSYLKVGNVQYKPVSAYVEMTPRAHEYIDIVFIFSIDRVQLRAVSTIHFVLKDAFFLSQPIQFTLPASTIAATLL